MFQLNIQLQVRSEPTDQLTQLPDDQAGGKAVDVTAVRCSAKSRKPWGITKAEAKRRVCDARRP